MPSITRATIELDATGKAVGRLAAEIALLLQGKHKVDFQPQADSGDKVVVRNAAKVKITGSKMDQKHFYAYSGYPGGMRATPLKDVMAKNPAKAIEHAVYSMLPKNRLRKDRLQRLTVHND